MKLSKSLLSALLVHLSKAAYIPSDPWTVLTPDAQLSNGIKDYPSTFGIQVIPISDILEKRDVTQIDDGQIQINTESQYLSTSTYVPIPSPVETMPVISQIDDGQIQATTETTTPSPVETVPIQATTETTTPSPVETVPVISQIDDGQIQASTQTITSTIVETLSADVTQIEDGQIQATQTASAEESEFEFESESESEFKTVVSCKSESTLSITLKDGILTDALGRIGAIVANRQFQFDGPPQAGTIYAAGWSINPQTGNLVLGDNEIFYQCLSGTFYNLYDEDIGSVCHPINLKVIDLVDC
ncbi:uncharacterized protein ASCRUDRAFT_68144 [Ascoidea rubescens DSM 1968]|uniref:Cell wall mannoprotein PIR1-like C-terminal domain-containing protein n=1 Tax=Ascoidea rubescens DSM 1968 TaxID=1344418 RepID=A0A1D2VR86_9ASCO|nr:hypothetical protein ASCRUDRAFT_68144 [Ascoidea rubescens DSM 1968]ODV64121.1 hypothetical protein ASCRUDRAFT_68144 [Ascoidea rubescens DSM 1968]